MLGEAHVLHQGLLTALRKPVGLDPDDASPCGTDRTMLPARGAFRAPGGDSRLTEDGEAECTE